ncbi:glycoside hydrolase family 19 protein [Aliikangiella sp. G2MR2-5]|uniref:glycoside hydrolase family 19 protein n=1 Tax=Aliikangiella sp. G2MR2-5 TaxID=2788943 RepID=UPI0018AA390E|nr:glycoside hydrolase family 19 protein [Aliikangiella sp. G2MR2-5]
MKIKHSISCAAALACAILSYGISPTVFASPATPQAPSIAWMPTQYEAPAKFTITWNMWWGTNGNHWRLIQNGKVVHSASLTPNGQSAQTASFQLSDLSEGSYAFAVSLCNLEGKDEACANSANKTIQVGAGSGGGELKKPGTPTLDNIQGNLDLSVGEVSPEIKWNKWSGESGSIWHLNQNGIRVFSENIAAASAQSGSHKTNLTSIGDYLFKIELCNKNDQQEVCSASDSKTVTVIKSAGNPNPDKPNPVPKPGGGYTLTQAEIDAMEAQLTSSEQFQLVKGSIETRANTEVEAVLPGRVNNPENVKRVEAILNESQWNYTFAERHGDYSYTRFLRAVAKFKAFCGTYTDGRDSEAICRKSLATMFAHFTQETGGHNPNSSIEEWRQGLVHLRELGCSEEGPGCEYNAECSPTTWQGQTWPCGKNSDGSFKKFFGRGAKQLSYNYNYGPFSQAMFADTSVLLKDPDRVARTWLNLASAVFFFVYPQPPKPSMLHVIDGTWQPNEHDLSLGITAGFGATTNIINGGIECNTANGEEKAQSLNRIAYYKEHAAALKVPIADNEVLGCANQGRFDTEGAGAMLISLDQDWSYHADMPEGKSFMCKTVGYQTAYSLLIPGDYQKCVEKHFDVEVLE